MPRFPALFRISSGAGQTVGMPGWGGRIRTSVWWNQNPLPYHLATPQQPNNERQRLFGTQALRPRRSIDGVELFQQGRSRKSGRIRPVVFAGGSALFRSCSKLQGLWRELRDTSFRGKTFFVFPPCEALTP